MKIRLNHLLVIKTVLLLAATLFWGTASQAATEIRDDQYIIFYHNDALGSPLVVTDHNGNTLWHEHSDPYGKTRDRVMPTGKEFFHDRVGSRKGYTGHLKDTGSDLVYMKARYYDPVIGRFYSNDPVGFNTANPMMFNRYAYANNNSYSYVDPTGKIPDNWSTNEEDNQSKVGCSVGCDVGGEDDLDNTENRDASSEKAGFWERYHRHLDEYLIDVGPYAASLMGGLWPKSWSPVTGGRRALLGSKNPLTSVPRALGVPGAGSTVVRAGASTIGVATIGIGYYNIGTFVIGLGYAAFPD